MDDLCMEHSAHEIGASEVGSSMFMAVKTPNYREGIAALARAQMGAV